MATVWHKVPVATAAEAYGDALRRIWAKYSVDVTDSAGRRNVGAFLARTRRHPLGAVLRIGARAIGMVAYHKPAALGLCPCVDCHGGMKEVSHGA